MVDQAVGTRLAADRLHRPPVGKEEVDLDRVVLPEKTEREKGHQVGEVAVKPGVPNLAPCAYWPSASA